MINIIFRNNTMIRILAIELLNRILILIILMIKSLLEETDGVP
jgi:multisubunit Na+/H+ antiporter MnhF subunit